MQQPTLVSKHAGSVRYAYNWALDNNKKGLEQKEKLLSSVDLHNVLRELLAIGGAR